MNESTSNSGDSEMNDASSPYQPPTGQRHRGGRWFESNIAHYLKIPEEL